MSDTLELKRCEVRVLRSMGPACAMCLHRGDEVGKGQDECACRTML